MLGRVEPRSSVSAVTRSPDALPHLMVTSVADKEDRRGGEARPRKDRESAASCARSWRAGPPNSTPARVLEAGVGDEWRAREEPRRDDAPRAEEAWIAIASTGSSMHASSSATAPAQ